MQSRWEGGSDGDEGSSLGRSKELCELVRHYFSLSRTLIALVMRLHIIEQIRVESIVRN